MNITLALVLLRILIVMAALIGAAIVFNNRRAVAFFLFVGFAVLALALAILRIGG